MENEKKKYHKGRETRSPSLPMEQRFKLSCAYPHFWPCGPFPFLFSLFLLVSCFQYSVCLLRANGPPDPFIVPELSF
jgi:hypothetical protein